MSWMTEDETDVKSQQQLLEFNGYSSLVHLHCVCFMLSRDWFMSLRS